MNVQAFEVCVQKTRSSCTQIEKSLTMTTEKFLKTPLEKFHQRCLRNLDLNSF